MTWLLQLAARSAWNRRFVLALVVASIALSTLLLLGIERLRHEVREGFAQSVSGTDLIVGPRTGAVQLLLYAVFRVGSATNTIAWQSVQDVAAMKAVAWAVPLSLGDSHRGFAVVATTPDYFVHFRHGDRQALVLTEGRAFADDHADEHAGVYEAVLGAEVAERLGHRLGDALVLSHGDGALAHNDHADKPFRVVGILARTGTPVDRSLHIPLAGQAAIHLDWVVGAPLPGTALSAAQALDHDLTPRRVNAVLVGLKTRAAVFAVQRRIAESTVEPLMAVLPGVALDELWVLIGAGERALLAASVLVSIVSLAGLVAVILAGLNERRRELAILRAVGCSPRTMLALLALEGALVTLAGVMLGLLLGALGLAAAAPWLQAHAGLTLSLAAPTATEWGLIGAVLLAGWLASLVPGWRAYRLSLADGLSPRL
jgi:putative ABC transport system permease protein